jgi:hypothetical protein
MKCGGCLETGSIHLRRHPETFYLNCYTQLQFKNMKQGCQGIEAYKLLAAFVSLFLNYGSGQWCATIRKSQM